MIQGCVRYLFASLFFKSTREHLLNWEKCFQFHFKSSFGSRENQSLEFQVFKSHDVIKCLSINPFHVTGLFWYPLKTSENQRFSDVLRGIKRDQWHEMGQKELHFTE